MDDDMLVFLVFLQESLDRGVGVGLEGKVGDSVWILF